LVVANVDCFAAISAWIRSMRVSAWGECDGGGEEGGE